MVLLAFAIMVDAMSPSKEPARRERPTWEPEPLHIPADPPDRIRQDRTSPPDGSSSGRRVVVIDLA